MKSINICVPRRLTAKVASVIERRMLQTPRNKKWGWIIVAHSIEKRGIRTALERVGLRFKRVGIIFIVEEIVALGKGCIVRFFDGFMKCSECGLSRSDGSCAVNRSRRSVRP